MKGRSQHALIAFLVLALPTGLPALPGALSTVNLPLIPWEVRGGGGQSNCTNFSLTAARAAPLPDHHIETMEAAVDRARQAWTAFDYRGALEVLDRASQAYSESPALLAAYGAVYLKAEEPARASQYFDRAIMLDPGCQAAALGQAEARLLERDYSGAENRLNKVLSKYPGRNKTASAAHALLARVRMETGLEIQAEAEAARAIDADEENANALCIMAFIRAAERKPNLVRSLARRAIEVDPYLAGARRLLSQYLNGSVGYQQQVEGVALELFEKGRSLQETGSLHDAALEFECAARARPGYYRALIALAALKLREGDYSQAIAAARTAIEADPEGAIANMELAYAQLGMAERARIEIGATDYSVRFFGQGVLPVTSSLLSVVFPDYHKLDGRGKFVLERSVAPLACFLTGLASSNARHYLLRLDQSISECPGFKEMKDRTTFDGRYYASIRGVGGRIALSGVEYLDEAARGGFNAIAHEFAHQVHETAMGPADLSAIHRLYEASKREHRALDYYAATNEFEYFASGYEAFVSTFKRPGAGFTACHTRDELKAVDPGLYGFITKMADKSVQLLMD
jgi:tetratricopeptide (TPR) repeat protein